MDSLKKYYVIGCHVLWREICHLASKSPHTYHIKFLTQGLHNTPELLRQELQQAINEVDNTYTAILVGYGLCSNGIHQIKAVNTRVVIPRAHDCITLFLGSKEIYQRYFNEHPGTYWYTPGWIETTTQPGKDRYEEAFQSYKEKYGEENAAYLMEMEQGWFKNYNNAAFIDWPVFDTDRYKAYTKEAAQWLNWDYDEVMGDPTLLNNLLLGQWDAGDFVILEPGERVAASNDEGILRVEKDK